MTEISQELAQRELTEARELAIRFALPGRYDGISSHATLRGDADDKPYMQAIIAALRHGKALGRQENLGGGGI